MSLTLQNHSITPAQVQHLRKASENQHNIRNKRAQESRQLSTLQSPTKIFTAPSGATKMGEGVYGNGAGVSAFCTSTSASPPSLYVTKGSTPLLVESGSTTSSFWAVSIAGLSNGNVALLYAQQQGSSVKIFGRVVSSSLSIGSKVEIGTGGTSTTHIDLFQVGAENFVIWNSGGKYLMQKVSSALQPSGSVNSNYGTDPNFPKSLTDITFHPIVFLKDSSGLGSAKYVIRKSDGIYSGTATASGLGTPSKISPDGTKFSCPDIVKTTDGSVTIATWGQHTSDGQNVVYAQKLSSSLSKEGSAVEVFKLPSSINPTSFDPLNTKVQGFSNGFLVVTSVYGTYFNALHLSSSLEVKGNPQSLTSTIVQTGGYGISSTGQDFNVAFMAFQNLASSSTASPDLYNLQGTFSFPAATSPTPAPAPTKNDNKPTKAPTPQTHYKGSAENPILVGDKDIRETFEGYAGGQTIMDGEGHTYTKTSRALTTINGEKYVPPEKGEGDTYKIISGPGVDNIVFFHVERDWLDLRGAGIKSINDFKKAVENPSDLLEVFVSYDNNQSKAKNMRRVDECLTQCPDLIVQDTFFCPSKNSDGISLKFGERLVTIEEGCFRPYQLKYDEASESSSTTPIVIGVVVGLVSLLAAIFAVYKCLNHKGDAKVNPNEQKQGG